MDFQYYVPQAGMKKRRKKAVVVIILGVLLLIFSGVVAVGVYLNSKHSKIFNENIDKLEQIRSDENFFCNTIKDYLEGTQLVKKILNTPCKVCEAHNAMKPSSASELKYFPKNSSSFSRKLNEERNTLINLGYDFKIEKKKDGSYIEFFKV